MGRVKLSVAGGKLTRPVVLHLDRAVAHDLLQALTQALEPRSTNVGKLRKGALKGRPLKGMRLEAKSVKGKSSKGKSPKGKSTKGMSTKEKRSKKSR